MEAGPANAWVTVSQAVELGENGVIEGYAAFSAYDDITYGYNDTAAVWVIDASDHKTTLWQESISEVGNQGHTLWEFWSFQAPAAGSYTLYFGAMNVGDPSDPTEGKYASYGLFTAVPEPSTWLAGGLLALWLGYTLLRQGRFITAGQNT